MTPEPLSLELERLTAEILAHALNEDDQFRAFHRALEDHLRLPMDGFVIGEPVSVVKVNYRGNPRRGLSATCRKRDGQEHDLALADVNSPASSEENRYLGAYRKWLGASPAAASSTVGKPGARQPKAVKDDITLDLSHPIELVVMSVKGSSIRGRPIGSRRQLTLRSSSGWRQVPGEIVTVRGKRFWRYAGHPYLSGEVLSHRQDITALDLTPLQLQEHDLWDPADEYWGDEGDPKPDWAQAIIAQGPRPSFEMEQIIPGEDPEDLDDPITRSVDLKEAGALDEAEILLMELLQADVRCLDAHVHLGNLEFDRCPEKAARHYSMAQRIGELSLRGDFRGVLCWGHINNRPYLRALHGLGLCLWRLKECPQAAVLFDRMLWLNPSDNQGARFLLPCIKAGMMWEESCATQAS